MDFSFGVVPILALQEITTQMLIGPTLVSYDSYHLMLSFTHALI